MRLTKQFVDALKPSSEEIFAWDSELKGFGVRVKPTGIKTYFLQYRNKQGRSRRYTLGRHGVFAPEEARKLARLRLADIQYGEDPAADRKSAREAPTISELCERYLTEHSEPHKKPSSVREDRRLIAKRINPAIGALSVESVTRADVMKLQHAMRKTPYDANRMLATLSKMFNLAEAWGLRPDGTNPVRHVQRFPERKRDQFLDMDQIKSFGTALDEAGKTGELHPTVISAMRLLLLTGCRLSELVSFEWERINWEAGTVRLADSKTGPKTIHLGTSALDLLSVMPRRGRYVFWAVRDPQMPLSISTIETAWRSIRMKAKLEGFRLHDLRHTYASWAVMGGQSLPITGALLGHSEAQTTQRYAHLASFRLREAANDVTHVLATALKVVSAS